ncbi:type II toxin-antitoxin system RelE/ParE family toxin [Candidatus Woesearchaeota archaeon]|nr:type II toxin-antitoxin system RelE/ParE family toxin [Candidatus Woesearchaeota archaeon]
MTYEIIWHPVAAKNLESLPHHDATRVLKKFDELSENPFRFLEHFEGGGYKFRVGNYRAIIDVDFERKLLKVRVFDKRERIY